MPASPPRCSTPARTSSSSNRKFPYVPDTFQDRHLGPRGDDLSRMLETVGSPSLEALIDEIVPADIRLTRPPALPEAETEFEYLQNLRRIAAENRVCRSYIGLGY